jgi:hypothetical protein
MSCAIVAGIAGLIGGTLGALGMAAAVMAKGRPGEPQDRGEPPALDLDDPENRARLEAWLRGTGGCNGR